jgi:hypothetical protein
VISGVFRRFLEGCREGRDGLAELEAEVIEVAIAGPPRSCGRKTDVTARRGMHACPRAGGIPIRASGVAMVRSLILTSQLPVSWHEQIGDPTVADGILDRLVLNAHRIEMRGDSMRKNRGKPNT